MNTAKNEVFCWLQHEGCYLVERFTFGGGEQKFSGRGVSTGGEFFQVGGGGMRKYLAGGRTLLSLPSRENHDPSSFFLFFCFLVFSVVPFYYDFMLIQFIKMTIWEIFLSSNGGICSSVVMQLLAEYHLDFFKIQFS